MPWKSSTERDLPRLDAHVPRCGAPRRSPRSWRRAAALILVHLLVVVHVAHWKTTGRTVTPLEPSEAMQTLELGYVNAGAIVFAALILLTLLLGRFFCGWACHLVAYQDLCAWLLEKAGVRPRPVRARVLRLVPWGAALYMFVWPTLVRWFHGRAMQPFTAHLTTDSFWRTFPGPWIAALTIVVDGALVVWWLGAKGFCSYGCPYGALFGLADRFAAGQIRVNDSCEGCGHCTAVCTSNVRVHEEVATFGRVVDAGCMKCLDCVNSCPKQALRFGFGRPSFLTRWFARDAARTRLPAAQRGVASDLSWPEEILAALVFLVALYAVRGLYGKVPFLLAIGLAVLASIAAVVATRLFDRADLRLQWGHLRVAGRFTRRGVATLVLAAAFLLFVAESSAVQYHGVEGEQALHRFLLDPGDAAAAAAARSHLTSALAFGLFPDGKNEHLLAVCLRRSGDPAGALLHMQRALAVERTAERLIELAAIEAGLRDRDAVRAALRDALALEPGNGEAARRLRELDGAGPPPPKR
jgi:polyferredoxin